MTDFLDEKRREIQARVKELRPLVDEFHRLEAAAAALDGVTVARSDGAASRTRRSRAAKSAAAGKPGASPRGRPKGSGNRSKQALEAVRAQPGVTIPELAEAMGIKQNYLYRVMPTLEKEGMVRKEGRGWHALEAA